MTVFCTGGQKDRPGLKPSSAGCHHNGVPRLNFHHFLSLKDPRIFQRMAHHEFHQHLAARLGDARVVFDDGRGGNLPSQRILFHNSGFKAAPGGVYPRRETRRPTAHNHQIRFDQRCIVIGNKDILLLQAKNRTHEQLFGLCPLGHQYLRWQRSAVRFAPNTPPPARDWPEYR